MDAIGVFGDSNVVAFSVEDGFDAVGIRFVGFSCAGNDAMAWCIGDPMGFAFSVVGTVDKTPAELAGNKESGVAVLMESVGFSVDGFDAVANRFVVFNDAMDWCTGVPKRFVFSDVGTVDKAPAELTGN